MLKHQDLVPAAVVNVFPITADPSMSTLRDNQLKIELRELRESWNASDYRSRFVVILVAEDGISTQEVEDRVANIRRATNLDPRSMHVLYNDLSAVEVKDFVRSFLSSLQPSLVDYYRDLSKHARRKRNRGTIPPPTVPPTRGTSQTLSMQGWNVRYEFKLGVFAEFRQEMEAAQRNFEAAYETLFGQEVFESIAGWNPRFNDARLLGDILAIRIIRCLLWSSQPTAAVRFWLSHKNYVEDIVSRRGKGTKNYGWEAWNARWSTVMAQLISRAELPAFSPDFLRNPARLYDSIFHPPEKGFSGEESLLPWESLHHQGYWLDRSARHTAKRQELAEQIPQEHRVSADKSPASQAVAQSQFYDTYLAPEPVAEVASDNGSGFDHTSLIIQTLTESLQHFAARDQVRKVESLSLEIAQFHIKAKQWHEAYDILKPLWPRLTWRQTGWWDLINEFAWAFRACAVELEDIDALIWIHWELLSKGSVVSCLRK
jgi:trafficking protein particle complex subunit 11